MPGGFRRAELRGSDELFRPTRPEADRERPQPPPAAVEPRTAAPEAAAPPRPAGHLVRLSNEDIDVLCDAIQRLKYPTTRPVQKPPMDVFERLEELRARLLEAR